MALAKARKSSRSAQIQVGGKSYRMKEKLYLFGTGIGVRLEALFKVKNSAKTACGEKNFTDSGAGATQVFR